VSKARQVATNTLYQIIGKVIVTFISLFSITITTRYLGTAGYGELTTAVVYLSFFGILVDWGIYTVAVRELAKYPNGAVRIISSIIYFRLFLSLAVMLIAASIASVLPYSATTKLAIFVATLSLPLNSLTQSFSVTFQANLQMKYATLSEILSRIAGLVLLLGAVLLDAGVVGVVTTSVIAALFASILSFYWMLRFVKPTAIPDLRYAWELFLAAIPLGIAAFINTIYFRIDTLMLSLIRGVTEVGIYGIAYRVIEIVITLPGFFVLSVFPIISGYVASRDARLPQAVQRSTDVLVITGVLTIVLIALLAKPIITLISGHQFVEAAQPLRVLMIGVGFSFLNLFLGYLLVAHDQQKKLLGIGIFALVINVASNLYAIPRFGYMGAAWTTVGSEVAVILVALKLVRDVYGQLLLFGILSKTFLAATMASVPTFAIVRIELPALLLLIVAGITFVGVYVPLLYLMGAVTPEEVRKIVKSQSHNNGREGKSGKI
jgi:O-antigen/teichoic acid export membrane protein